MFQVAIQRFATLGGDSEFGSRNSTFELFFAADVSGALELSCVHAQVTVCRAEQGLQLCKGQSGGNGQARKYSEPDPVVQQAVEIIRRLVGYESGYRLQRTLGIAGCFDCSLSGHVYHPYSTTIPSKYPPAEDDVQPAEHGTQVNV